jgi:para-aminobenzoate synthetase component I
VYARVGRRPLTVLLESSVAMPGLTGWSYIAGPALAILVTDENETRLRDPDGRPLNESWSDPFDAVRDLLERVASAAAPDRPAGLGFAGGLIGHLGYDLARHVERLPVRARNDPVLPRLRLHLCDHVLALDHARNQWYFCSLDWPGADADRRRGIWAETLGLAQGGLPISGEFSAGEMVSRTRPLRYLAQVEQVQEFIAEGDLYEANLSHRLEGPFEGDPFALYQRLTQLNPAPFSAYLQGDDYAVASVSPERFLKVENRQVTARPIKGTRPRDADPVRDRQAHDTLYDSVKDRAENLMIVDLMRNDLGRVAQVGSVQVDGLFEIEGHPSVWQMVSTVRATLRDDRTVADLLRACWPPGSMTGAPKVRAMQIIESLEPLRRGIYAGAIGYLDAGGAADLSVVIRTAVVHRDKVMVQVGGAVVADSVAQEELDETFAKGRLLLVALRGSRGA